MLKQEMELLGDWNIWEIVELRRVSCCVTKIPACVVQEAGKIEGIKDFRCRPEVDFEHAFWARHLESGRVPVVPAVWCRSWRVASVAVEEIGLIAASV